MAATCRAHVFFLLFMHRKRGPLLGWLMVSPKAGDRWETSWDIGTIDRDPRLSDDWFCRDECESRFRDVLQAAADKSFDFEVPGAASRWGMAAGMPYKTALDLAEQILALWQDILLDWEARGSVGNDLKR
jgi:hypothetical protein